LSVGSVNGTEDVAGAKAGAPTLAVVSVRELRVVDLPDDGFPTKAMRGSLPMLARERKVWWWGRRDEDGFVGLVVSLINHQSFRGSQTRQLFKVRFGGATKGIRAVSLWMGRQELPLADYVHVRVRWSIRIILEVL
jgi:hypothetical protein